MHLLVTMAAWNDTGRVMLMSAAALMFGASLCTAFAPASAASPMLRGGTRPMCKFCNRPLAKKAVKDPVPKTVPRMMDSELDGPPNEQQNRVKWMAPVQLLQDSEADGKGVTIPLFPLGGYVYLVSPDCTYFLIHNSCALLVLISPSSDLLEDHVLQSCRSALANCKRCSAHVRADKLIFHHWQPNTEHTLNIFEPRYRSGNRLISHILSGATACTCVLCGNEEAVVRSSQSSRSLMI